MKKKNSAPPTVDENVTLILTRIEVGQILAVLKHTESVVELVDPKGTQNFLGKLIKKVGKAIAKVK